MRKRITFDMNRNSITIFPSFKRSLKLSGGYSIEIRNYQKEDGISSIIMNFSQNEEGRSSCKRVINLFNALDQRQIRAGHPEISSYMDSTAPSRCYIKFLDSKYSVRVLK